LHAVLVLPVAGAGAASHVVQERAVPGPDGTRAAGPAARDGPRSARERRDPRLGLERGGPLPGAARAAGRGGAPRRGGAGWARHPRRHDRDGASVTPRPDLEVAAMTGAAALPRRNGELVFEAPWQGRALGMALAVIERLGLPWTEFQRRLIEEIGARP